MPSKDMPNDRHRKGRTRSPRFRFDHHAGGTSRHPCLPRISDAVAYGWTNEPRSSSSTDVTGRLGAHPLRPAAGVLDTAFARRGGGRSSSPRSLRTIGEGTGQCGCDLQPLKENAILQQVEKVPVTEAAHKARGGGHSPPRDRGASAERHQPRSLRRSPKPYLATAHVPRDANNATMIPNGIIARSLPRCCK